MRKYNRRGDFASQASKIVIVPAVIKYHLSTSDLHPESISIYYQGHMTKEAEDEEHYVWFDSSKSECDMPFGTRTVFATNLKLQADSPFVVKVTQLQMPYYPLVLDVEMSVHSHTLFFHCSWKWENTPVSAAVGSHSDSCVIEWI